MAIKTVADRPVARLPAQSMSRYLTASPYLQEDHLLDLQTLNTENQLMARALTHFTNTRDDYATAGYVDSFNWGVVMAELKKLAKDSNHLWQKTTFYIVAFRSRIPPTTKYADLAILDEAAHAEAVESGGLLKYWFGSPDVNGRNLATCVWRSEDDARIGGVGPAHRKASAATGHLYAEWGIDRIRLDVEDGIQSWRIVPWED